jgi:hypothetical protein
MKMLAKPRLMLAPLALFAPLALVSTPLFAAAKKPPMAAPTAAPMPVAVPMDPAKITAAKAVVDKLWPLGTYDRVMDATMGGFMDSLMDQIMAMRLTDLVPPEMQKDMPKGPEAKMTFKEIMAKEDPHFVERMRISSTVMNTEMKPILAKWEPAVRDIMAKALGKKFSTTQLTDLAAFFGTPSGSAFAKEWMVLYLEPEYYLSMKDMIPDLIKIGPGIAKKVEAATAHLPMPKRTYPAGGEDMAGAAEAGSAVVDAAEAEMAAGAMDAAKDAANPEPWTDPANWTAAERAAYEKLDGEIMTKVEGQMAISSAASEKAKARMEKASTAADKKKK